MTRRIFRSICLVAIGGFLAAALLFLGMLYHYFSGVQREQLRMQTGLAARGVAHEGMGYFQGLELRDYRITWIDPDGTVRYDSRSDRSGMENHLEREEVREALTTGIGESTRYSKTLLERSLYCARRLEDGTVLRLSVGQHTPVTLFLGTLQPICLVVLLAVGASLALAARLARKIVQPLNELNLDEPLSDEGYDELAPLLRRISAQQGEIRRQREELAQKQREFEAVTGGMAEGIVLLNRQHRIVSLNPAARRLFSTDLSCVGRDIQTVHRSLELQTLLEGTESGTHGEMILELAGGRYQLDASPIYAQGQVSGTALLLLDVTQRERNEQLRREFTANVSHELKTPLHTISGCAELMANGLVRQEDLEGFATRIYTEAQRMTRLVEDILKLSCLDEGAQGMERERVDLYTLAQQTVERLEPLAQEARITMTLEGESAVLTGIPQLLQGIVYNLCDNALRYNVPGGRVRVSVDPLPGVIRLTVADTGIGIPPEHQERIFERFYRVDKSHSRAVGGTGLGLSIVKHAARLHRAALELNSQPGGGTTITVTFPTT